MLKRKWLQVTIAFLLLVVSSCDNQKKNTYTIGFSQCTGMDSWRQTMLNEMKLELSFYDNIKFVYRDANGNSARQVQQIEELKNSGIDLLIVSPNEVKPLTPAIEKVYNAGIPVVVVDRRMGSNKYTSFIGASNLEVGHQAGYYTGTLLKGQGNVIEVTGIPDASPVIDRHDGFVEAIAKFPGITLLKKFDNYITTTPGIRNPVEEYLKQGKNVDLIYAQNDYMAADLYKVCKKLHLDQKIKILGIDGLAGEHEGLDMVNNKKISATVLYPTGGQEAVVTAIAILENQPYKKEQQLFTTIIDSTNVAIMKRQAGKVLAQQKDIETRQGRINQLAALTKNQSTIIIIVSLLLLLAIFFGAALFYYLKENKKINTKLAAQNKEIAEQKNRIEEMSAKAERAHQAKLSFFTNISHEFRTPMTLILAPVEELLQNPKLQPATRQTVQLVQRNVMRLYRLVNQLMDFRKVEIEKMKRRVSENDLVAFTKEITASYNVLAAQKQIDLQFFTTERTLPLWFDVNMIDKVIFNLLSNAFKFTKEAGYISVSVNRTEKTAQITVEDNGVGMSREALDHVFEPFFQGEYENYKGSGLGLALSKEFIELHKGIIRVNSEKGKGTKFTVELPLGKEHLSAEEISTQHNQHSLIYEEAKIFTSELLPLAKRQDTETTSEGPQKSQCILLIEDNESLRNYLKERLEKHYHILEAEEGNKALSLAIENIPDLIISDVVIPGKSGLEVTRILKNDVRTSHVPIVLLTSRSEEQQQLEGMNAQADAYLTKPFSLPILEKTISNFLLNCGKIKAHYSGEVFSEEKQQASRKTDRKFISEFTAIVENNLSNENFTVEDICAVMALSKVQLYRKVKALLNCSVNDYVISTRLQKAKYFLQHEDLSISEVAFKTGFASSTYFSTVFKAKFGMKPSEFKSGKPIG
jgi:signal transduction histidine kinase/DNA-binding response OmpR family regulator